MLELTAVRVAFPIAGRLVPVVRDVDLSVRPGELLALVGESGCGKSTIARTVVRLERPIAGTVSLDGADVHALRGDALRAYRRAVQMVFQDPFQSLSPRQTVARALAEPLHIHRIGSRAARRQRVAELLELVELDPGLAGRRPRELSGGQRQRVAIARALAVRPRLLICDEPVTALDAPVQATVLNLIRDLVDRLGLGCLFIAHDLAVVRQLADRVAVMYRGRIVESAPTLRLMDAARHPYTQALLAAVPRLDADPSPAPTLRGEMPGPLASIDGCAFNPRCPQAFDRCEAERPQMIVGPRPDESVACHRQNQEQA
ncbi:MULTISPECIES: oligopeptide/dipeptide ABC transporter ATP-binding protein [Micromonospora]|uniref:ABC transporter ATP-binding protein n=1 Tax=Micromonospora humida TaxID=2809018 RepID=A0ABS2IN83_9ACTN|nr:MULTISPECIES: oligopeptide/dipeptide ABC transporter ATP-binding protein [Micromonospora]MBM7075474.1 ABC transporter ATP-binding protein [Micromonospora humida]